MVKILGELLGGEIRLDTHENYPWWLAHVDTTFERAQPAYAERMQLNFLHA